MANPKRRHSNMRTSLRRTHDSLALVSLTRCPQCKAPVLPHHICPTCGYYRGRQVKTLTVKTKESKE